MKHRCVGCGKIYEHASEEIIKGCPCGSRLFYFVKSPSKKKDTKDDGEVDYFYEMEDDESQEVMIFDIESINIKSSGKYELDINSLMNQGLKENNGLIYKYGDGKYGIDLENNLNNIRQKKGSPKKKSKTI